MSELDKKRSIYWSISYFEEIKENNQTNLVTTTKKIKFNVRENTYKEEIILELTQVSNEDIDTTVILLITLVFW